MRVVFFGTPEFAVPSLHALVGEGFDVLAAVTRPDRATGRSRSRRDPPPVKLAAQAESLPVLQPENPRAADFLTAVRELGADVGVVVAYGHILSAELLAVPRHGMVNVHPSLLPALRGAAPVEWAILNGLEETGVTIMQPVLHQIPHRLDGDETGGELSEHLAEMGAQALVETLAMLEAEELTPVPQDASRATFAPKLTRALARIDWTKPAESAARWIRGLDPRPGAWTTHPDAGEVKLFGAKPARGAGEPGEILRADQELLIAAGRGAVTVSEVQPTGRDRMSAADWVRGRGAQAGQRLA
jgi:methionyl-tRNA formyltransferase